MACARPLNRSAQRCARLLLFAVQQEQPPARPCLHRFFAAMTIAEMLFFMRGVAPSWRRFAPLCFANSPVTPIAVCKRWLSPFCRLKARSGVRAVFCLRRDKNNRLCARAFFVFLLRRLSRRCFFHRGLCLFLAAVCAAWVALGWLYRPRVLQNKYLAAQRGDRRRDVESCRQTAAVTRRRGRGGF